jgi:hypothetical protein
MPRPVLVGNSDPDVLVMQSAEERDGACGRAPAAKRLAAQHIQLVPQYRDFDFESRA